jgi:hypothetical protein
MTTEANFNIKDMGHRDAYELTTGTPISVTMRERRGRRKGKTKNREKREEGTKKAGGFLPSSSGPIMPALQVPTS